MSHQHGTKPVVGIPRGLLYFAYQPLWATFFSALGVEIRVSPPTDRSCLELAGDLTQSDLCLPVKVYLAHVARLKDEVDWLLLPRITSVSPDAYMCPKILGLTDMIRNVFEKLPPLLSPHVDVKLRKPKDMKEAFVSIGRQFTDSDRQLRDAWGAASEAQDTFQRQLLLRPLDEAMRPWDEAFLRQEAGTPSGRDYRVAVIGRSYLTYDSVLSHNLLGTLKRRRVLALGHEAVAAEIKEKHNDRLPKKVYWQLGKELVAAGMFYAEQPDIDGIISISSFACGQDSFTTALVEHYVRKRSNKPFLSLLVDEHNSDCALTTRIEAFLDMLEQRKRRVRASIVSAYRPAGESLPVLHAPGRSAKENSEDDSSQIREMHLSIPHMGYLHLAFEKVFRDLGVQISMPPRPNKETLMLGARYSPECACLPFKLNLGNMIQALENHGTTDIIIPGGCGPCRFGYYGVIQELILRDLGYQFRMGRTDDPDSLRDMAAMVRRIAKLNSRWSSYKVFIFILYRVALVDRALHKANMLRPREAEKRAADRAFRRSLDVIDRTRRFRDLWPARRKIDQLFSQEPIDRERPVLRVGLVGEIFMVLENYANMSVESRLGEMGVEVHRGLWLSEWLNDRFRFMPFCRNRFKWSLRQAAPYMVDDSGGDCVNSVGMAHYCARGGFDGIVHVMPFTCMPELIAQTIIARISSDFNIPVLTLVFDEHTSAGAVQTRLEAFVDLMRRRRQARSRPIR